MWDLASACLFYFSIAAVSTLTVLLIFQWIGQLRGKDTPFKFTIALSTVIDRLSSRPRNWPDVPKLVAGIILAVLFSRFFIFLLGSTWSLYFTDGHTLDFRAIWQKWDTYHYLFIAQNGYVTTPRDKAVLIAFYPLYPLLIKTFWFVFRDYALAGYFVSIVSLMVACYFLYKLVEAHASASAAAKAVLFLLVSPFSVFLGLLFTESLFLALVLTFFYALTKQRWLWAGGVGFLAALTKNQGLLLLVPFWVEAVAALVHQPRGPAQMQAWWSGLKTLAPVTLIPAGFLLYLLINLLVFGDPFQFLDFQKTHWFNSFGFFAKNIENLWRQVPSYTGHNWRFSIMLLQPVIFVTALILLFIAIAKKLPLSTTAFSLAYLLISFSPTWLVSGARYATTLFFIPMLLAMLSTTTPRLILLSNISISLMTFFVVVYVEGALL